MAPFRRTISGPGSSKQKSTNAVRKTYIFFWLLTLLVAFLAGLEYGAILSPADSSSSSSTIVGGAPAAVQKTVSASYQLAYDQSFGFFDNIPEEDWKMYQERARTAKDHRFNNPLKFWFSPGWWYMLNYEPVFTCPHVRRVGGVGDGPKWTCDPHRLVRYAQQHDGCLVYSIGSAGKFEFEDGLVDLIGTKTCEVHIFDPGNYEKEDMAEKNFFFHRWGMRSSYNDDYKPVIKYGQFKTFPETLKELGHANRRIDILKIDCEFCEWFSILDFLNTTDVRQILIETHELPHVEYSKEHKDAWPYPPMNPLDYFDAFKQHGFMLFSKEVNGHPQAAGRGVEWSYVKLHPDFIGDARINT